MFAAAAAAVARATQLGAQRHASVRRHAVGVCVGLAARMFSTSAAAAEVDKIPEVPRVSLVEPIFVHERGMALINDPSVNKSTAWPAAERDQLGLRGLQPARIGTLEQQAKRVMQKYMNETSDLARYQFLSALQDRNEVLFFKMLADNIEQLAPIVYTPTVGKVSEQYGMLFRRPRGLWVSIADKGDVLSTVYNWPQDNVDVIVVTDGSRILGLGDLGSNGMGIPVGKLALYVAAGGIHPKRVLPVMLDVGTDNETLRKDPLYLGTQQPRVRGREFFELVSEFMEAVRQRWPHVLVQFEDFSADHAHPLLHAFRRRHLCFNDDIQGTGAVTVAGLFTALRAQQLPASEIRKQKVVVLGGGTAGLGVSFAIQSAMMQAGASEEEASANIYLVDKDGLITHDRRSLTYGQVKFARKDLPDGLPLLDVVRTAKPQVLLGVTGVQGLFTEPVVREVARHHERPLVFPLSNPIHKAECTAEQACEWTDGRAFFASGSPFQPVVCGDRTFTVNQCNNMFIFPGLGQAAVATRAKRISVDMWIVAAQALADCVTDEDLAIGRIYPRVRDIRSVSHRIATAVAKRCIENGHAQRLPEEDETVEEFVARHMWQPRYQPIIYRGSQ